MRIQVYFRENGGDWVEDSSGAELIRSVLRLKSDRTIESDRRTALMRFAERAAQFPCTERLLYLDGREAANIYPVDYEDAYARIKGVNGSTGANGSGGAGGVSTTTVIHENHVILRAPSGKAIAVYSPKCGKVLAPMHNLKACAILDFVKEFSPRPHVQYVNTESFHAIYDQRKNW